VSPVPRPYFHDTGEGPAVLFLHAFPLDASQWDRQVAAISDGYRCLRPDAFGCGSSPPPPAGLTLDDVAAAILAGLDARDISAVATVGLSMGGYVAMAMLRRQPDRVRALLLADTRATADGDAARQDRLAMAAKVRSEGVETIVEPMTERLLAPGSMLDSHISDPVRGRIRRCTAAGVAACQEAMAARPDSTEVCAGLRIPVLCVCGAEDRLTPPDEMRSLAAAIPGARYELIDGAGHLSNLEQPARFDEIVRGFVDTAYASPSGQRRA
jgi:3-oxoadipate enol-lactonase